MGPTLILPEDPLDVSTVEFEVVQKYSLVQEAERETDSVHKLVHLWGEDRLDSRF